MSDRLSQHCASGWVRLGTVLLLCGGVAACASNGLQLFGRQRGTPPFRDPSLSMQAASNSVTPGQTSKAEVLAALGPATVVKFDSGYEVWAYRTKSADPIATQAELVILFASSGIVTKSRIRPAYVLPTP